MAQRTIRLPPTRRIFDPARDAARLLGWFGLSVLMVAAPLAGVVSRRSLFVLLPVGAGLLVAAYFLAVSKVGLETFRDVLTRPVAQAAGFLLAWAGLSLLWTPFPEDGGPRLLATVATVLFATLIIAHMPDRRASKALYLLPAGVCVTAFATLAMVLFEPSAFRGGSEFDPSLLERSVLTLVVLVWPALGALAIFERWHLAMGLAVLVAATITVTGTPIAMAVFVFGATTFALAVDDAPRTARFAALLFAGLLVLAPTLPFALAPLSAALPPVGKSTVAAMLDWRTLVAGDGVRLITGHGLGTAGQGIGQWLPSHTPRTTLFEVWYELGMLGAFALAAFFASGLRLGGEVASSAAPALVAGIVVTISVAMFGVATAQVWFITLASLQAVAFGLLCHSSRADERPAVPASGRPWAGELAPDPDARSMTQKVLPGEPKRA